jgi:hypothetical protein
MIATCFDQRGFPSGSPHINTLTGSTGRCRFMPGIRSLKTVAHIEIAQMVHKIPIKNSVYPGVRILTTSNCIVCDYTTSGHTDL